MGTIIEIEATRAKARFASLPEQAQTQDVAITRHGHIQAYVLSPERYAALAAVDRVGADAMHKLDDAFAALVARMQSGSHARAATRLATAPLDTILASTQPAKPVRKPRKRRTSA
ncbi:MAG TPA: type II toxin-antitoxin system Phd/YefM family antitoxin [Rhodanobacteraceae bacterium]